MRRFFGFSGARFAAALLLLSLSTAVAALAASADARIAQAVTPLPEDLRAGATVVTYGDPSTGARQVLRQGTSTLECQPENPKDGFTRCYSNLVAPRLRLPGQAARRKEVR